MLTFAYEYATDRQVIVTDGTEENSFVYPFGKDQDIEISIRESTLLAELEIARKNPPAPVVI